MICRKCGKRLKEGEMFCTICGCFNDPNDTSNYDDNKKGNFTNDDEVNLLKEDEESVNDGIEIQAFSPDTTTDDDTKKTGFFDFQDDRFLEAYIGDDYKVVARKKINIYALLLSWIYFLYRKLYITGIIGLIITGIFIKFFTKYLIVFIIVSMIFSGLLFNPIYIAVAKQRVLKIKKEEEYSDDFETEQVCAKKGGVNFVVPIIIYLLFLVAMFFSMYDVIFPKKTSKFYKENNENQASCISLVKRIYTQRETLKINGNIKEGTCVITPGVNKDYNIYIMVQNDKKTFYQFYKTENNYLVIKGSTEYLTELQEKVQNKTISKEEETYLNNSVNIESKFRTVKTTSQTEDELIVKNKDSSEKLNYVIGEEEFKR